MNDDAQECVDAAIALLRPATADDEATIRAFIELIRKRYDRRQLNREYKSDRQLLNRLAKALQKAAGLAKGLGPAAYDALEDDTEFYVLNDLADSAERAAERVLLQKGGHLPDNKKRQLVLRSLQLFEQWRPSEARKTFGDFEQFVEHIYNAATGQKQCNLERAIDWAFAEMSQSGARRPMPIARTHKGN